MITVEDLSKDLYDCEGGEIVLISNGQHVSLLTESYLELGRATQRSC